MWHVSSRSGVATLRTLLLTYLLTYLLTVPFITTLSVLWHCSYLGHQPIGGFRHMRRGEILPLITTDFCHLPQRYMSKFRHSDSRCYDIAAKLVSTSRVFVEFVSQNSNYV